MKNNRTTDKGVASNVGLEIKAAMSHIAKRRPGKSRLVYDKATRTIRIKGQRGEDKGDSGLKIHDF